MRLSTSSRSAALVSQDLSIAGKRAGIHDGKRSSLFFEAIRIIKEMRCGTHGKYPRYAVWENVTGAYSSNGGEDFRSVLEAFCSVKDGGVTLPRPAKWEYAGEIVADGYSIAWRTLDAQYWGIPQRRKRIYLVADLDGQRAGKILFESDGLSRYFTESKPSWQNVTRTSSDSPGASGGICLNDQGGVRMDITDDVTCTLRAQMKSHLPCVLDKTVFENHGQDTRYTGPLATAPTISSTYGTGGNNQPFVVQTPKAYDVRFTSEGTVNARANCYETDTARTIDTGGIPPDANQGGVAVVNVPTYAMTTGSFAHVSEETAPTLTARDYKDPATVNRGYSVRRLTPKECARLQGFPDWWCADLETDNPTEEDILFWREVFETYRKVTGTSQKPKTDKQIVKWLRSPYTDGAEYTLWGNGIALPCGYFVLAGIVYYAQTMAK